MAARGGGRPSGPDPLSGVELVLVDGNNLIGDRRLPPGAVIGPIRAAIPPGVRVELLFDGPPRGGITGRLATGFSVRYSGRVPADDVILDVVGRQAAEHGPAATWTILVVTDDRQLRDAARMRGARTAGVAWLTARAGAIASGRAAGGPEGGGPAGRRGGGPRAGGPRAAMGGGATSPTSGGPTRRARAGTSLGHGRPPGRPDSDA